METEERVKALEEEFRLTKDEIKQLLTDIRARLMEAGSPLRNSTGGNKSSNTGGAGKR